MNARLKVLHEKSNVKQVKLQPTTVVGRSTECDLKIASNLVSRLHCRFTLREDAVYLEDLGSANGTFVDGEILKPHESTAIKPGAKNGIGPAEFLVDYVAPTTNTIVLRRSEGGARPGPQEIRNANVDDESELIITSSRGLTEPIASPAAKPVAVAVAVAAAKSVPVTPAVTTAPIAARASAAPVAVAAPVAAASPAAVVAAKRTVPVNPPSDRPFTFGGPSSSNVVEPKLPVSASKKVLEKPLSIAPPVPVAPPAPVAPPVVPQVEFSEFVEPTPAIVDEVPGFNFTDSSEPRPTSKPSMKDAKPGIKSLLSLFNRKSKSTEPTLAASLSPLESPEELSHPANVTVGDSSSESFGFEFGAEEAEAPKAPSGETGPDDDFQKFLGQF